jgi:hypothetical protein
MTDTPLPKASHAMRAGALNVTWAGNDRLFIETASGQNITIQGNDQGVRIQDASGDSIQLQGGNIQIRASAQVSIQCSAIHISASTITVDAGMTKFSGVVQADTLIANNVVASSYTPGAGNIW